MGTQDSNTLLTPLSLWFFAFDYRSNSDEDFELELVGILKNCKYFHIYIDTLVSTRFDFENFNGECLLSKFFVSKLRYII